MNDRVGRDAEAVTERTQEQDEVREFADICPQDIRLSSRELEWGPLHFERRECEPDAFSFGAARTEHLIGVSLSTGKVHVVHEGHAIDVDLVPGSVTIIPSDAAMQWMWPTRLSFAVMALAPDYLLQVACESLGLQVEDVSLRAGVHDADPTVSAIASALSRELIDGKPGSEAYVRSLAHILAMHLLRQYNHVLPASDAQPMVTASRPVARAVQHIRAHFAEDLALADIAAAAQVSPFHLARLFKQATGRTPHQYLIEVRVESARALLTAGANRSLAEVAEAVGFADQSHLTRHMKRLLGVTPGGLRDQIKSPEKAGPRAMVRSLKEGAKRALSSARRLRSPAVAG